MRKRFYNPYFTPMQYSPALWLDASDVSTLVMDGARTFNGSGQYLSVASNGTLQTGSDCWFSLWVKLTGGTNIRQIWDKYGATATAAEYVIELNASNVPYFTIYNSAGTAKQVLASAGALSAGVWTHIFCYYDSVNQTINISTNGSAFNNTSTSGFTLATSNAPVNLGAYNNIASAQTWYGGIDSATFGKPTSGWLASNATALRDYLYNSGSGRRSSDFMASAYYINGNPSGAVSWWDMDARSGDEPDRIGSNNLTDNGGVGYASGIASGIVQYTGDPVKQWSDKSGNARHVTAAADSRRPTYTTAVQNGLPMVVFDGVDDYLQKTGLTIASPVTVFGVVIPTLPGAGSTYIMDGYTHNQHAWLVSSGGLWNLRTGGGAVSENVSSLTTLTPYVVGFVLNGTGASTFYLNGAATSLATNLVVSSTGVTLGARADGVALGAHKIGEFALIPSALGTSDCAKWSRYLGNKWGITVS